MGFISSADMRAIMFAQQAACSRGGEVRVCGLNAQAHRIFEMARLDECLRLTDTRQEAREAW